MLSQEDNELLTRVGPGTPMGSLLRQYWLPVMLGAELPDPGGDPQRVRLLGEDLIIFRDTYGRVGLVEEHCAHRGASLFFGRNEAGGLRCVYHGWQYDVSGRCMDMPSEPAESNFRDKVRQRAYPCREAGGMVWAYMGSREAPPAMPDLEWLSINADHVQLAPFQRECNWVQALEGDIDTSHTGFLHSRLRAEDPFTYGVAHVDNHPALEIVPTDYGVVYASRREEANDAYYWRVTQFLFPFHTLFPGYPDGLVPGHIWVPLDDAHTMVWALGWNPGKAIDNPGVSRGMTGGLVGEFLPATTDGLGRWRPRANKHNDYEIDREMQRTRSFTGIGAIALQDQAVTESMGAVYRRTNEHLGTSDAMIIQVRRRLIAAAKGLRDHGTVPPGVDNPEWYRIRSCSVTLPRSARWLEETQDWRAARTNVLPGMPAAR